jgi:hypothetical protein
MIVHVEVEGNEVYLYSAEGGRMAHLGQSFNTDEDIKRVVLRAIEFGRKIGLQEVRNAIGLP